MSTAPQLNLFGENSEAFCDRCGAKCRVSGPGKAEARLLRLSAKPKGFCTTCAVTTWLMNCYPINEQLHSMGPEVLLHPGIQEIFFGVMRAGNADMKPEEIDWRLVVKNWHLPIEVKRSAENPWLPTDPKWEM